MTVTATSLKNAAVGLLVGLWVSAAGMQSAASADVRDPIQREDLALIDAQLARIDVVIDRLASRQAADPDRRVILDVDHLRGDIRAIRSGIRGYLSPPRLPPRQPTPLSGAYLDQRAQAQR